MLKQQVQKNTIQLFGAGTPRALRPIWVAEELGVEYDLSPIGPRTGETQTPKYTALNPKQKIPLLIDGQRTVSESLAICRYLNNHYGNNSDNNSDNNSIWQPKTLLEKTREDEWCCYIYGEVDETGLYIIRRHMELASVYGESPVAVQAAKDYIERQFRILDEHLTQREYLLTEGFSLADILLMSCLHWSAFYGMTLPNALTNYQQRIAKRAAYVRAMSINYSTEALNHGTT